MKHPFNLLCVSPNVILCGWLGSKHQLTNLLCIFIFFFQNACSQLCFTFFLQQYLALNSFWVYDMSYLFAFIDQTVCHLQAWHPLTSFYVQMICFVSPRCLIPLTWDLSLNWMCVQNQMHLNILNSQETQTNWETHMPLTDYQSKQAASQIFPPPVKQKH